MTTENIVSAPATIWTLPPNVLVGLVVILTGMLGFLSYWVDWGWIQSIYEMRILLIPVGLCMIVYPQLPPLGVFLIAILVGGMIWALT